MLDDFAVGLLVVGIVACIITFSLGIAIGHWLI